LFISDIINNTGLQTKIFSADLITSIDLTQFDNADFRNKVRIFVSRQTFSQNDFMYFA